jgi:hypothetical protein
MEAMHTDRMDLVDHFKKEKKPYSGPRPAQGFGIADRPPARPWRESLGRFLTSQLTMRPAIRWEMSWSGATTTELSATINKLCERNVIRLERHAPPGGIVFWTISRGLAFNPQTIEKEVINA